MQRSIRSSSSQEPEQLKKNGNAKCQNFNDQTVNEVACKMCSSLLIAHSNGI
jgi:hypothetical protein